jgi:hypothetical protein
MQQINKAAYAESLIPSQRQGSSLQPFRIRHQALEEKTLPRCRVKLFLDMAHGKRQPGRLNPDGTEIAAGHAGETTVHLLDEIRAEFKLAFKPFSRKRYAAARRGRFLEVFAIGRADSEAQSAADTVVICGFVRLDQIQSGFLSSPKTKIQPQTSHLETGRFMRDLRPI